MTSNKTYEFRDLLDVHFIIRQGGLLAPHLRISSKFNGFYLEEIIDV